MDGNHWQELLAGSAGVQHVGDGSSSATMWNMAHGQDQSQQLQAAKMVEAILFAQPQPSLHQPSVAASFAPTNSAGAQSMLHQFMGMNERSHCYEQQPEFLDLLKQTKQLAFRKRTQLKKGPQVRLSNLIVQIVEEEQLVGSRYQQSPGFRLQLIRDLELMLKLAEQKKVSPQSQRRLCVEMRKIIATVPKIEKRETEKEKKKQLTEEKKPNYKWVAQPQQSLHQPSVAASVAPTNSAGAQPMLHQFMGMNERSHCYEQQPEFLNLLREIEQRTDRGELKRRPKLRLSSLIAKIIDEEQTGELGSRYEPSPGARMQLLRDLGVMIKLAHQKKISPQSQQRLCKAMTTMIAKAPTNAKLEKKKEKKEKKKQLREKEKKEKQKKKGFAGN